MLRKRERKRWRASGGRKIEKRKLVRDSEKRKGQKKKRNRRRK